MVGAKARGARKVSTVSIDIDVVIDHYKDVTIQNNPFRATREDDRMSELQPVPQLLTEDLVFGEGPRWRGGVLWFSDMHGEAVWTVDLSGNRTRMVDLPGRRPSGLGFLPNGDLLIVSMLEAKILRWDGADLSTHADLTELFVDGCNDMVVDHNGRAYVGSFPSVAAPAGRIVAVDPDGSGRVVADQVVIPNGSVITPDGKTFIVAESLGRRLTAFDIEYNGDLSNRRVYAECPNRGPDGICLDEEGAVWAAMPLAREFQRIMPGGEVVDSVTIDERMGIACALGGLDRKTLFLLTAMDHDPIALAGTREGQIHTMAVAVPGAGIP
jgi:sugar lactone lactonase YvrE